MQFILGVVAGALLAGLFGFAGGIDEGGQRAYKHCVEHQAKTAMLRDARDYCRAVTGRKV